MAPDAVARMTHGDDQRWLVATHKSLVSRPIHYWLPRPREAGILVLPAKHARSSDADLFRAYFTVDDYTADAVSGMLHELAARYGVTRLSSATEVDVSRLAMIRSALGLRGLGPVDALPFTDKSVMRERAQAAGIASPPHTNLPSDISEAAIESGWGLGWPLVAKPRFGTGGRGIKVLNTATDARLWLNRIGTSLNGRTGWLLERFVRGGVFHIDGLTQRGTLIHAWPSKYNIGALEALEENRPHTSYLLDVADPLTRGLIGFAKSLLYQFPHLEDLTAFHLEVFVGERGPVLCEVACRPAGGGVDTTHHHVFGLSLAREHLGGQLGLPQQRAPSANPATYAGWALLPALGSHLVARLDLPDGLCVVKAGLPAIGAVAASREVSDAVGLLVLSGSDPLHVQRQLKRVEEWWMSDTVWR